MGKLRFIAPQPIALYLASLVLCSGCGGDSKTMMNLAPAGSTPEAAGASATPTSGAAGSGASATSGGAGAATSGAAGQPSTMKPSSGAGAPATNGPMGSTMTPPTTTSMTATAGSSAAGAAGDMGTAGTGAMDPGGAAKDAVNTDQMGPYKFDKYTEGLTNPTYASSVMYYPTDAPTPFGAAVFSPGFTATKENYEMFLGPLLASHGIAILLTTPTTTGDFPQQRAEDLQAAVEQIAKENTREGSPVKGKLDPDRVCVTGHSMGGGGTLWAASALGDKIKCAVPLQPWQPGQSFSMIKAPTMFIAAQSDTVAGVAQNASLFYASIPDSVKKYYVEFAGASHFLTTNDLGTAYDVQSKYMIAFYKTYLDGDMRYLDVLNGPMDKALSKYEHTQ